jgi:hypothetical protein
MLWKILEYRILIAQPNDCELSGRGWLFHPLFQIHESQFSPAFAADSPVRSSELLGRLMHQRWV